jgi:hypothetical protein
LNAEGLCSMHAGTTDPRELGRLSAKRRREPNPERVPASLRQELQKLDPAIVRGAIERALAGDNESARVSAVKLLADVDAFRRDNLCSRCGATPESLEAERAGSRQRLIELLCDRAERRADRVEEQGIDPEVEAEVERRTAELAGERDQAIPERDQALARLAEFTGLAAGA